MGNKSTAVQQPDESWKAGYRAALARYFARHGSIPAERIDSFGWEDHGKSVKLRQHGRNCEPWVIESEVTETGWWEFDGTDHGSKYTYLATAVLTCRCRRYRSVEVRVNASVGDVIHGVVSD